MDRPREVALGPALRRYREAAGLTQEELAEQANVSVRTISNIERGASHMPRLHTIRNLATALDLPPDAAALLRALARVPNGSDRGMPSDERATPQPERGIWPLQVRHVPLMPLFGRDDEIASLVELIRRRQTRLLTLTGLGGVGKTRVALTVAEQVAPEFSDGACFVSLAAARTTNDVLAAIAAELGLREESTHSLEQVLGTCLSGREALLVLDNCEQVLPAGPTIMQLANTCPRIVFLATSRTALRVRGEFTVEIAPLDAPGDAPGDVPCDLQALSRVPAVALFVQRAQAVLPTFHVHAANAQAIAAICRRLDGLPLALELAATRTRLFSASELLARLERRLLTLTGGALDLPPRQQTLHNTLAWSYDLLSAGAQAVFRRLAVFPGGWTLEAAEAVCTMLGGLDGGVVDELGEVLDHHLLQRDTWEREGRVVLPEEDAEPRFAMLETVREYALMQLELHGERQAAQSGHVLYYVELAETAEPQLAGPRQRFWVEHLELEMANLRAALGWAIEHSQLDSALRLAGALWWFWYVRGHYHEGRGWLERALTLAEDLGEGTRVRKLRGCYAKVLSAAAWLADSQGDYARARQRAEQSLSIYRTLDDLEGMGMALHVLAMGERKQGHLANALHLAEQSLDLARRAGDTILVGAALGNLAALAWLQADYARAQLLCGESVALFRERGDTYRMAHNLNNLGVLAEAQGDYERAASIYEESLVLERELGDLRGVSIVLSNLGEVMEAQGHLDRASRLFDESLALRRTMGNAAGVADSLMRLAHLDAMRGDYDRARARYGESLRLAVQLGTQPAVADALAGMARTLARHGEAERAVRLLGSATGLRSRIGIAMNAAERDAHDTVLQEVRTAVGQERFALLWAEGEAAPLQQAIEEAIGEPALRAPPTAGDAGSS